MRSGTAEYGQAVFDIEEAYKNGLRAFAKWCSEYWKIGPNDAEIRADKSPDYIEGYNAAMDAIEGGLDCFLEEYGP